MTFANPFACVVVGYDDSAAADAALRQAVALAEQYHGEVVAVHVSDLAAPAVMPLPTASPAFFDRAPLLAALEPYRRELYDKLCASVASCAVPVSLELAQNAAAAGILDAAQRWNATAIAVGTHGRTGLAHAFIGSVAEEILRSAPLPVVVTREGAFRAPVRRLVAGVDASEPTPNASAFALALGHAQGVRLLYCTVSDAASIMRQGAALAFDPTPFLSEMRVSARNALDAALQAANGEDVYPDTEVVDAIDAGSGLCEVARRHDADAIVVGSHKRGSVERFFLGSTAEAVIHAAERPVMVVPADARVVPAPTALRVASES
jgi:nucleotide-binding universal stress UspA family protein